MAEFDPEKPVQTRDGRTARIICVNRNGLKPIVALVGLEEQPLVFYIDGRNSTTELLNGDLINIPQYYHDFENIYDFYHAGKTFTSMEEANANIVENAKRIGVLERIIDENDEIVDIKFYKVI